MRQALTSLRIRTPGRGLVEITGETGRWLAAQKMDSGLLTLFLRHTSASLLIQGNAAPEARQDLEAFFDRLAPDSADLYRHQDEGPDDMPAHIRAAVTPVQLSVPVAGGRLVLGTWQEIFVFEHRHAPHEREVVLHLLGD